MFRRSKLGIFSDIALTDNQATGYRFGIGPYWRQNLGGWVELLLRYRYDDIFYDQEDDSGGSQANEQASISDSRADTIDFSLARGRQFSVLRWKLGYFYQRQQQDNQGNIDTTDNGDDRRENMTGQLSYRLNKQWALLAEAGYENNQVTDFEASRNGAYWGLGAIWSPGRFLE